MQAAEIADQPGREITCGGDHGEAQLAALQPAHFRKFLAKHVQPRVYFPRRPRARPAGLGEKELLARLLMQGRAERVRQLLDLNGKSRGRHMHFLGGAGHVHVSAERREQAQLMQGHPAQHHYTPL